MEVPQLTENLAHNAERIRALVAGVSLETARWKPGPEHWSVLEVVCHLLDEERLDFRVRLDLLLHLPGQAWPHIDPVGWVTEHRYNEQDLAETLRAFLEERQSSLKWLAGLDAPDWETAAEAPWGVIHAGDLLAAWAAHDLLHLRQLVELHYAATQKAAEPYSLMYAGEW